MKMLLGEKAIANSYGITLTNYRIRHFFQKGGDPSVTSILLENIQSISMQYKSKPLLLIIGILLAAAAVLFSEGKAETIFAGIVIGGAFIVYYLYTRKHYLTIASAGEAINVLIKGLSSTQLIEYIDLMEEAICNRKSELIKENIL